MYRSGSLLSAAKDCSSPTVKLVFKGLETEASPTVKLVFKGLETEATKWPIIISLHQVHKRSMLLVLSTKSLTALAILCSQLTLQAKGTSFLLGRFQSSWFSQDLPARPTKQQPALSITPRVC